jgi:fermentation-respiration switch protein FrsA (DUF1100 family)
MLIRIVIFAIFAIFLLIISQDIQIFPGVILSRLTGNKNFIPNNVHRVTLSTKDGQTVDSWYLPVSGDSSKISLVIIFHGNGDNLETTYDLQQWLRSLGFSSISFDYRGYRNSSGWPSEKGIYMDTDAVWDYAHQQLGFLPTNTILLGISIGCAPASYLAEKISPSRLVLLSPFVSLKVLIGEHPVFRFLSKFLWYNFPTANNVSKLTETSLVVIHGKKDTIVPIKHGLSVFNAYQGKGRKIFYEIAKANHNDLFIFGKEEIARSIEEKTGEFNLGRANNN